MELIKNTFVLVAADCPVGAAEIPSVRSGGPTVSAIHYALLTSDPYAFTHEELIFATHVRSSGLSEVEVLEQSARIRGELFSKPQACMRASPLPKRYGWGVHYNAEGKLALFAVESDEYRRFAAGEVEGVKVVPAMRNKRAS